MLDIKKERCKLESTIQQEEIISVYETKQWKQICFSNVAKMSRTSLKLTIEVFHKHR